MVDELEGTLKSGRFLPHQEEAAVRREALESGDLAGNLSET